MSYGDVRPSFPKPTWLCFSTSALACRRGHYSLVSKTLTMCRQTPMPAILHARVSSHKPGQPPCRPVAYRYEGDDPPKLPEERGTSLRQSGFSGRCCKSIKLNIELAIGVVRWISVT